MSETYVNESDQLSGLTEQRDRQSTGNLIHSFGVASLIVVLGVCATWFLVKRDHAPQELEFPEVMLPEANPISANQDSLTLLEQAELAFAAGRIIEPEYDNALGYYLTLLKKEPDNAVAAEGVEKVKTYLLTQADSAMYQNDWDAARAYARVIKGIEPGNALAKEINAQANRLEAIGKLSDEAVRLLARGNLISPKGASAVESYRGILKLDSNNTIALEGIRSISQRLIASAQSAIFAGDIDEARGLIKQAKSIDPGAPGLADAQQSAREWEQVIKDRDIQKDLTGAAEALRENRLMPPLEGNAFELFQRVKERNPESESATRGIDLVQTLLLDRAMSKLNAEDMEGGEKAITLASQAGASEEKLATAVAELKYRKRLLDARAGVFDRIYGLSELKNIHRESPEYPRTASLREKEGWVELEFTVTETGDVRDARVKKSSSELFERNALAAVSKWRFEPEKEGGRPIPVRAAIKFTFK